MGHPNSQPTHTHTHTREVHESPNDYVILYLKLLQVPKGLIAILTTRKDILIQDLDHRTQILSTDLIRLTWLSRSHVLSLALRTGWEVIKKKKASPLLSPVSRVSSPARFFFLLPLFLNGIDELMEKNQNNSQTIQISHHLLCLIPPSFGSWRSVLLCFVYLLLLSLLITSFIRISKKQK